MLPQITPALTAVPPSANKSSAPPVFHSENQGCCAWGIHSDALHLPVGTRSVFTPLGSPVMTPLGDFFVVYEGSLLLTPFITLP